MTETAVGTVEHYYPKAHAAVVRLQSELHVGDVVHIVGHTTDLTERVDRLEVDHRPIGEARPGRSVGLHVLDRVREGDHVYRVSSSARDSSKE